MGYLSSLRRLSSSSLIDISGCLKSISHMPFRFASASPDCLERSNSAPYALNFRSFVHSAGRKDFETWRNSKPMDFRGVMGQDNSQMGRNSNQMDFVRRVIGQDNSQMGRNSNKMDFVRRVIGQDNSQIGRNSNSMDFVRGVIGQDSSLFPRYNVEQSADFVLIQLKRNNTHINVTDSKGNTKFWTSSGNKEVGGGGKVPRYAAEATAEYVGRRVREMGLKSVVIRVNGFTYFKKKRQAIMSFKEGFSNSRSDRNPIVYIEDITRRPHNGCRLPKKRRI